MRRLRTTDKSGAGESSAVLMEEQGTKAVRGRSIRKITATVSAVSLPPCIGVKSCRCRRCTCRRCLLLLSARGTISPPAGQCAGDPERFVSGVGRGRGGPCSQSAPGVFCRARCDWLAMTSCCSIGWGQSRRWRLLQRQRGRSDDGDRCRGRYGTQAVTKGISRLFPDHFFMSLREQLRLPRETPRRDTSRGV
ncbi:uncharacterized protein [Manis javanica]|uniref:uncharacterized protein isoform X2 n=1 Tax=Manis javanica TaxID=9974 RepID=UPI00081330E0|nr:uncharacterized protein LOC108389725 isoform X2 [Manis javanica]